MRRSRRVVRQRISFEFLEQFLKGIFGVVRGTDCPKDMKVVGVEGLFDGNFNRYFDVFCQSDLFEEVPLGAVIPLGEPFVYTVDKEWEIYKTEKRNVKTDG